MACTRRLSLLVIAFIAVACGAAAAGGEAPSRAAVLQSLNHGDAQSRVAALDALGNVGTAEDVSLLAETAFAGTQMERNMAFDSLTRLRAQGTEAAILAYLKQAKPAVRAVLMRVLAGRQSPSAVPGLLVAAKDPDPGVRIEALKALRVLAAGTDAPALIRILAGTPPGAEREAADRAVWTACKRIAEGRQLAEPLLRALAVADAVTRSALLPTLGRLGDDCGLVLIHAAMQDAREEVRDAGVRALGNWPTVAVADELLGIAKTGKKKSHRVWALRAYARLVALPNPRPANVTFVMLKQAMDLAERAEDKRLVLTRISAVPLPESLAFVVGYLERLDLEPEASAATARLAESLLGSHPEAARAAQERVRGATKDESLLGHVEELLRTTASPP